MGSGSYMSDKKGEQVAWSQTFVDVVGPNVADYGVPAAMMTDFTTINTNLQAAWLASNQLSTRTRGTVAARDNLLTEMKTAAKALVSIIQGMPNVTDQMKIDAGVTVRKTKPTPKPAPTERPFLKVTAVNGRTVTLELRQDSSRRGKPAGVMSATLLTASGETAPMSGDGWSFSQIVTTTTATIEFPPSDVGDTVYVTGFWLNSRGEAGPAAVPLSINLPAGGQFAAKAMTGMRIAKAA